MLYHMLYDTLYEYWTNTPKDWIPITDADKKRVDAYVYNNFYNFNIIAKNKNDIMSNIIYLDQFFRHFQRYGKDISEDEIIEKRYQAIEFSELLFKHFDHELTEIDLIFSLMPYKHLHINEQLIFIRINEWLSSQDGVLKNYTHLSKFYNDCYKKYYNKLSLITNHNIEKLTSEEYDEISSSHHISRDEKKISLNIEIIDDLITVSLSGGVDSMVILYLLSQLREKKKFTLQAVHIIYGNRKESQLEYKFIVEYCNRLNVDLITYQIEHLRRNNVEREFYEKMTREIRFNVYKILGGTIVLGHIKEDVIENIWTNFANGRDLFNLGKMPKVGVYDGVKIYRPFLNVEKEDIFQVAYNFKIPYLKNTTPEWSNRGKYRNDFHPQLIKQYGASVDNHVLYLAESIQGYGAYLEKTLFQNILDSLVVKDKIYTYTIPNQDIKGIGQHFWQELFERIMHKDLHISKPSIKSMSEFTNVMQMKEKFKFHLKKNLLVEIKNDKIFFVL